MNNNELPERLPVRPLRNWFLAWHIHTGDPVEVIAKGFDLHDEIVRELLDGRPPLMINTAEALAICKAARLEPKELWPIAITSHLSASNDSVASDDAVAVVFGALGR